ncbi:MAG TPA: undecaprenyl-phosphate glucose phosphotransferase [Polyangiaceae bacterium]|jgi:Undecaprenyl-phosphate glucose phosphotransferase|nr:undecaprenyl-phosphate glucose phosphotransferase [Polyangiaceae bacterium]
MLRRYQHVVVELFRAADVCVIVGAWLVAYWIRAWTPPFDTAHRLPSFRTYASLAPLVAVLWLTVLTFGGAYESSRMRTRRSEVLALLRGHGLALLAFIAITYMYDEYKYSRLVMIYFAAAGALGLAVFRVVLRTFLRSLRKRGHNLRYVLIVGESRQSEHLIQRLTSYPEIGLRVVGVLTDDASELEECQGAPVLGHYGDVRSVLEATHVDEVVISLSSTHESYLHEILSQIHCETVGVRIALDVQEHVTLGCGVEEFEGVPIVRLNDAPMTEMGAVGKRLTDMALSSIGILFLTPLLAFIALLVKVTSPGPILYAQERMGLDGRTFRMLKFRSMRTDAEVESGAVWCRQQDERRTPIGAFLRRTSLDELPQLWNVLVGDMSLVGPRPERPVFVNQFRRNMPHYMLRHKVKAGITGWAQVNGWRGNTSLDSRVECDLYYIQNWSFFFDLQILVMTIWKGFVNKNAY